MLKHIGKVMTVRGPIDAGAMGLTLPHEHVLVDFAGAEKVSRDNYDQDVAFEFILPHLQQIRNLGCQSFVECTPSYIGKDVTLCRRLSETTGLHVLTNVGYYGAGEDKYLPAHTYDESADQLAARWLQDAEGIDGTSIQPGFIKIGVDASSLSTVDEKLVRAAARAHLRSGLLIMSHTAYATPAMEQIAVLQQEGVHPSAWVWTHAQVEPDQDAQAAAARAGAWVAFDGCGPEEIERDVANLLAMKRQGLLGHVHLSHDAGWYQPQSEKDPQIEQDYVAHDFIFSELWGTLKDAGLTQEDLDLVCVQNPQRAFAIGRREL
jgi:predicted metal-dependent phosphotriesterase family hydrolase